MRRPASTLVARGLVGAVGYVERCNPALIDMRRRIAQGQLGEIEIEIQLAVEGAHQEEIPRRIDADLLHQFPQRHRLPRALAQLYDLTVTIETHHLQEKHRKLLRIA